MKKIALSCSLGLLLLASACSPANPPQAGGNAQGNSPSTEQMTYGLLGPGPVNYWDRAQKSDYRLDSEANHSPSFRTLSPERPTLGDDEEKIREIVNLQGMDAEMVIIAGSHAWVNVNVAPNINGEKKQEKIKELNKALEHGIPRYQVHINVPS